MDAQTVMWNGRHVVNNELKWWCHRLYPGIWRNPRKERYSPVTGRGMSKSATFKPPRRRLLRGKSKAKPIISTESYNSECSRAVVFNLSYGKTSYIKTKHMTVYNLNYSPTALGVQGWREITSAGMGTKRFNTTGPGQSEKYSYNDLSVNL
jgi:hypothetical protein